MTRTSLRFATYLAPSVFSVYAFIAEYVGRTLGIETSLQVGESFAQFERGEADVGFICGLPYVQLMRQANAPIELLAAPVLQGDRYGGRPIYYSDVIVRAESNYKSFADLRGCTWSFNDRDSQSGYGITRYTLARMGETNGYFGRVVEAGFHQESIKLVRKGTVDASAIDSQVLALELCETPELAYELRIVAELGPCTIQPVVAASRLPAGLKEEIKAVLVSMAADAVARENLARGMFERFVAVPDSQYDDIREMLRVTQAAGLNVLR